MRRLGIATMGLAAGLVLGLVAQDVVSRALMDDGGFPDSVPLAIVVGLLIPVLAATGVFVALAIDARRERPPTGAS